MKTEKSPTISFYEIVWYTSGAIVAIGIFLVGWIATVWFLDQIF